MAMNYQNFASLGVNLNRQKYGPLDISNVFTSAADLKYYLTKGTFTDGVSEYWYKSADEKIVPYPYEGQVLATVINGAVEVFVLALNAEGNFETREIAGKIEVDGTTIVKDADGKLSIVAPTNPDSTKTYNFAYANGVYSWVEVDTATAAGQAQAIAGLTDRTVALETAVNGKAAVGEEGAEGYQPAVVGLVEKIAANTQAIADEAAARDAAIGKAAEGETAATGVYAAIAEALQDAKDYADAQDADTVYDDTALAARVKAIEDDYLKEADKYDDTELAGRVAAIEGDYLKSTDKYDDTALAARVKALEDEERYDDTDLQTRVGTLETASADHETRIGKVEDFFKTADGESLSEAMDTLIEIQKEIASDNEGAAAMLASIEANTAAIIKLNGDAATEGSVDKKIADAIAPLATTEALNGVKETAEAAQTAEEVEAAIENAFTEANLAQYAKDADVVKSVDFETFKDENTTAIGDAKDAAIAAAKSETETQVGVLETSVAETYATKTELSEAVEGIENNLLVYAKTEDVNKELAKKLEKVTIAHAVPAVEADPENGIEAVEGIPEGVTYDGVTAQIVVDAPTRAETIKMIADKVADVTGGESAADVKLGLEAEVERSTAKDSAHDAALAILQGDASKAGSVAEAKALAQKGVDDAAQAASDLVTANDLIADNAREIATVKSNLENVNTNLGNKITTLETAKGEQATQISGLDGRLTTAESNITTNSTDINTIKGQITALGNEDTRLAGLIDGLGTSKANAADVYTKADADAAIDAAIDTKLIDVNAAIAGKADTSVVNAALDLKANAADVYAKADVYTKDEANAEFLTQDEVDARINALIVAADPEGGKTISDIQNLVKYVDENAGEIAALVTASDANTAKLAGIDGTVTGYVADEIAKLIQPKASTEITVAEDGTLGIGEISTDKLVQGTNTLVLNGGTATINQ